MTKLYVISIHSGSYDSYAVDLEAVTDNLEKGTQFVDKMNQVSAAVKAKKNMLYGQALRDWQNQNPRPSINIKSLKGKDKSHPLVRHKSDMELAEKIKNWAQGQIDFINNWKNENLTKEEKDIFDMDEPMWNIKEVKNLDELL